MNKVRHTPSGVSVTEFDKELVRDSLEDIRVGTLERLQWAYHTIEDQLTFGMPPEQAIIRRERRVKGVLRDSIEEIALIVKQLEIARTALQKVATFGHDFSNPNCCPDAPVYECCCYELSQWEIAQKALGEIEGVSTLD